MREMTLEEIQHVSLEILKDVHRFCVENGIKYSLCYGTLLGAIRHNGFIPWDDDIDIMMPRPEYEKFIRSYQSEKGYTLFAAENNDGDTEVSIAFARVCEMKMTFVDTGIGPWCNKRTGVWIDIFPIDGAPDDDNKAWKRLNEMNRLSSLVSKLRIRKGYRFVYKAKTLKFQIRLIAKNIVALFIRDDVVGRYIGMCREYKFDETNHIANYSCAYYKEKERHRRDVMNSYILHTFESEQFYIISGYEDYLSRIYGDYMKLPPVDKRVSLHRFNTFYQLTSL